MTLSTERPVVKQPRTYDVRRRQQAARRTRERITAVAERLFLLDGYAATTIAAIAAAADVSVDTVYKSFGGKPGLVREIWERALEGAGPVPAERRSEEIQRREPDARKIIAAWGEFVAEISPRATSILVLVRSAAASDQELLRLLEELNATRLRRMVANARRLRRNGHLRAGVSVAQAADVLWTYSSPELYELLVLRRGWTPQRYGRFAAEAMIAALL